jgi:hypothetical protein
MVTTPKAGLAEVVANTCEALPSPPRPRSRGHLAVVVALLVGVGVGAGGLLVAQHLGGSASDESSRALASMSGELPGASAAEVPAARCQADMVSLAMSAEQPHEPAATTPPPASAPAATPPSAPGRAGAQVEPVVLATVKGPERAPATSPRPASKPTPQTFQQAMARIEPKIRDCARKAGLTETPTTVQVRRKDGALDTVRVLKLTKEHPFSTCVDQTVRKATLPAGTSPIEAFTFFQ